MRVLLDFLQILDAGETTREGQWLLETRRGGRPRPPGKLMRGHSTDEGVLGYVGAGGSSNARYLDKPSAFA